MRRIDTEIHCDFDSLVELRLGAVFDELDRLRDRIGLFPVDALASYFRTFSDCHDRYSVTERPIERAEPSTIFIAASMVSQLRSFIFCSAISRTCFLVTCPTGSRPGVFEPLSSLAAFFRK